MGRGLALEPQAILEARLHQALRAVLVGDLVCLRILVLVGHGECPVHVSRSERDLALQVHAQRGVALDPAAHLEVGPDGDDAGHGEGGTELVGV